MMRSCLVILLSLIVASVQAQQSFGSFDELLHYADAHGPAAQQAKLQPSIAQQDIRIQASGLYPKVNAFATGDYYPLIPTQVIPAEVLGGPAGTYYKAQFGLPYIFTTGAELTMPVINFEKWAQLSKAKAMYHQSEWNSKAALENYHIQLMQAYYQSLVTKEVLKLNEENESTTKELERIMKDRFTAGVLNPADYNRSKNLMLDVQSTGIGYEKTLQQTVNNLNALIDTKADSFLLTESLSAFEWKMPAYGSDPSARPGWKEADSKLDVAQLALKESRLGGLPKLALASRYAYNMQSKFEGGSNVEFNTANIGLRVDVPLFQGNYYRSLQHKNKLLVQSADWDRQRIRAVLTQQQADWDNQYKTAFNRHLVLEEKLKTTSDNLRIARLNIKEGTMEFDEFNNIFIEYNRARMEYLQNLADGILFYYLSTQKF